MSDVPVGEGAGAVQAPTFEILHQYIKDLSLEVPGAPQSLHLKAPPEVNVNVDVGVQQVGDTSEYEVVLRIDARGNSEGNALFIVELAYGGLFRVGGELPPDHLQPLLMIEAPRLLFPFARNVVAGCTRDGGLPPLMIAPIDFVQLFRRRMERAKAAAEADGNGSDGASG